MPINNNHLYRILITRSKQTNKRREMRRAVREEVGLMLWWLRADLRSVGPPTSKMYLRVEYRSTCYECFNATVRPFSFFSSCHFILFSSLVVYILTSVEKIFNAARARARESAVEDVKNDRRYDSSEIQRRLRNNSLTHRRAKYPVCEFVHLQPINYEYRPEDCSLSGAYSFVGGRVGKRGKEFAFRGDFHGAILSRDDVHDR